MLRRKCAISSEGEDRRKSNLIRDGTRWSASTTCAVTSKVTMALLGEEKPLKHKKSTGRLSLSVHRVTLHTSSKVRRSQVTRRMSWPIISHELSNSPLAWGGGILQRMHYRPYNLLCFCRHFISADWQNIVHLLLVRHRYIYFLCN